MPQPVRSDISYSVVIASLTGSYTLNINSPGEDFSLVWLVGFEFTNDIINPSQRGTVILSTESLADAKLYFIDGLVSGGDFCYIYENNVPIFIAFIEQISLDYSASGCTVVLTIGNFLAQSMLISAAQTNTDVPSGDISQFLTVQKTLFGDFVDFIFDGTIISASNVVRPTVFYLTGKTETASSTLKKSSQVYTFLQPTMSRYEALARTIYPYHRVFFQSGGDIFFSPLLTVDLDTRWQTADITRMTFIDNSAKMPNRSVMNSVNLNINITTENPEDTNTCLYTETTPSSTGPFVNSYDLLNSGRFEILKWNTNQISSATLQDNVFWGTLKNINGAVLSNIQQHGYDSSQHNQQLFSQTEVGQKYLAVSNVFSSRILAEAYVDYWQVSIDIPRICTYSSSPNNPVLAPLPLNGTIGTLASLFNESLFCRGHRLRYSAEDGALLTVFLTKPYVYTGLWFSSAS